MNDRVKKYNREQVQLMDVGKLQPQAVELEEAIIGAILLESDALGIVMGILRPESFYKEAHELIFQTCKEMFSRAEPVDILTITQELKKKEILDRVGGAYYITQMTNKVASAANTEFHCRIVQQKFIQRELIRLSTDTIREAYEESIDVFDLIDKAERNLFLITQQTHKKEATSAHTLVNKVITEMENVAARKDGLSGIPSGLTRLDKLTGGWQKSDLIILAARPAMGKTALATTIAKNAAVIFKIPTAIFSLEMRETQLMRRIISAESKINGYSLKNSSVLSMDDWNNITISSGRIANSPIFIDDTPALSVFELRAKARRMKEKHKIELIVIDYLQLMTTGLDGNKNNREQEISYISRSLKALAKELDVPVIALSQLSRAVESRGGSKEPQLSDLRESGAIEQDADMVIFPHRPEYYGIMEDEKGHSTVGKAKLIIAKQRDGATGDANVSYIAPLTLFCDSDDYSIYSNDKSPF